MQLHNYKESMIYPLILAVACGVIRLSHSYLLNFLIAMLSKWKKNLKCIIAKNSYNLAVVAKLQDILPIRVVPKI